MSRLARVLGWMMATASAVVPAMFLALPARAQDAFPTRTVKLVVPSVAGSTTDALARLLADGLAKRWGSPTIVENMAGAGMNIGARSVARAAPDGHTLLVAPPGPVSFSHLLYRDPGYDPTEFVPITMVAKTPNVLIVRKAFPATTLQELIAYAKANPGKVTYGSAGAGSTAHLTVAQIEVRTGVKMVHVPYRGSQPALTDVLGGHLDIFFETLSTSAPLYREGALKALAIADLKRADVIAEVPTMAEAGLPGFRSITWFGLVAPPGTPPALADRLNRDAVQVLRSAEVSETMRRLALDVGATSPAETKAFFAEEAALWSQVIKEAGIEQQ